MARAGSGIERGGEAEEVRIVLGLLQSVENDGSQTQRRMASELGIALGLVNSYLKRCVAKGLLKVSKAPARRYFYYVTPRGFVEKSRLTMEYLSSSFEFFRQARADFREILGAAHGRGFQRVALVGVSDLCEIATLCAIETGVDVVIVDGAYGEPSLIGHPVVSTFDALSHPVDAAVVTDMKAPQDVWAACVARFGAERTFAPALFGPMNVNGNGGGAK